MSKPEGHFVILDIRDIVRDFRAALSLLPASVEQRVDKYIDKFIGTLVDLDNQTEYRAMIVADTAEMYTHLLNSHDVHWFKQNLANLGDRLYELVYHLRCYNIEDGTFPFEYIRSTDSDLVLLYWPDMSFRD